VALAVAACSGAPAPQAPSPAAGNAAPEPAVTPEQVQIESVELSPVATGTRVELETSGPLVWTTYRDGDENLVVELPNSRPADGLADQMPAAGLVAAVRFESEESGVRPLTRVVIATRAAAEHAVIAEGSRLLVELDPVDPDWAIALAAEDEPPIEAPTETASEVEAVSVGEPIAEPTAGEAPADSAIEAEPTLPAMAATRLVGIEVEGSGEVIHVLGDGEFYYSSFNLENPDRFVVDLVGVVNAAQQAAVAVGGDLVDRVRLAQFKSQPELIARVVVDLKLAATPQVVSDGGGLSLRFAAEGPTTLAEDLMAEPAVEEYVEPEAMGGDEAMAAVPTYADPVAAKEVGEASYEAAEEVAEEPAEEPAYQDPEPEPAYQEPAAEEPAWEEPAAAAPTYEEPAAEEVYQEPIYEEPLYEQPAAAAPVYEETHEEPPPAVQQGFEMFEVDGPGGGDADEGETGFASRRLDSAEKVYYGEPMTITLKDADVKDVLRSFAQISGLNVVVNPGVSGRVTVELTNVPWDQALEQVLKINNLGYELEGNIMRIAPLAKLREEAEEEQRLRQAQALSIPLSTVMKRVSYADASQISNLLQSGGGASLMSQRGSVVVDSRTNTLIIKELPTFMDAIITVIETLDTPEPQVMIEARIIETTKRFSSTLGIAWGFDGVADAAHGNTTGLVFPNNIATSGGVNLETGGATGFLDISLGNVLNTFTLDAALQAAESDGLINILSAPRITTLNNQLASIQSGLQIPIQTVANNTVSVQFVNATLRLDVTPHVTAEGTVLMDINIQKREPQLAFAVVGAQNAPISTKDARTRVIVRDGGTTVIGGIYKVSTDRGEDRVPGLANVPILKHLFKNKRRSEENEELLIFITPRVVKL
jgi:type IV pilus assembly protein PilQ